MTQNLSGLRERWRDPLLTALTVLLVLLLFVLAPLRADNMPGVRELGFALVATVTGAVFIISGRVVAMMALLVALALAASAAIFRLHQPSNLDIYLNASAWLLLGLVLVPFQASQSRTAPIWRQT